jgi:carbonic anhydrase/acetyltransferase-like protein (isoleucine patch superfamily)
MNRPLRALRALIELSRGHLVRISCAIRGVQFTAGRRLRVDGRLIVKGPGRVIIGDDVRVGGVVTPWTYRAEAIIEIGDESFINGASFGAWQSISVGKRCILGRCSIMDTDFHSISADRHNPAAPVRVRAVRVDDNVWICANAGILPGTTVGRNSVVGFGAVCAGNYPADMVIAGNPARVVRPIDGSEQVGWSGLPSNHSPEISP